MNIDSIISNLFRIKRCLQGVDIITSCPSFGVAYLLFNQLPSILGKDFIAGDGTNLELMLDQFEEGILLRMSDLTWCY